MKKTIKLTALFVSLIFAVNTFASKTSKKMVKTAQKTMEVDTKKSTFTWTGTKAIGSKHYGPVPLKSAKLNLKNKQIVGGEFIMDVTKIDATDMNGNPLKAKLVNHLKAADFFDTKNYPEAKLEITDLGSKVAKGNLTIKEVTRAITIPYTKSGNTFEGTMTFNRTKFGLKTGSKNFFAKLADDKVIKDDVTIDFKVTLK